MGRRGTGRWARATPGPCPATTHSLLAGACVAPRASRRSGRVLLPAFAAQILGSAHGLDDGTLLATLTLSGVRAPIGFPTVRAPNGDARRGPRRDCSGSQ
ncbi:TIGR02679 domain-containing protein [Streptomyces sp. NPDC001933]|uniref:TIGR02679 domain-containing protein n=1 Tax=Streptomyces sp. NPDC001933 TaxID=3364626 RepID=UPI00368440A6